MIQEKETRKSPFLTDIIQRSYETQQLASTIFNNEQVCSNAWPLEMIKKNLLSHSHNWKFSLENVQFELSVCRCLYIFNRNKIG